METKNKSKKIIFIIFLALLLVGFGKPSETKAAWYDVFDFSSVFTDDKLYDIPEDVWLEGYQSGTKPGAVKDGYKLFKKVDGKYRMVGPDGKEIDPDSQEYKDRLEELRALLKKHLDIAGASAEDVSDAYAEAMKNEQCPENPNFWSAPICWLGDKIQKIAFGVIYLILAGAVVLVSLIGNLATALFVHMIDGSIITGVLNNHIIYDLWTSVRDLLNIVFITALLYSAFSTIFQVESFHAKKIIVKVVIAAFLVNFSFPIARFIVDFFNYFMYYFVGALGFNDPEANSLFGDSGPINQVRDLALTINQDYITKENLAMAMMAIVFIFIFSTTLLIIAFLFIIRIMVLALLIIFSPIAFVGPLLPFTATYAKQWWQKLFQYCMFGPIMIFMLYIATQFMIAVSDLSLNSAAAGGGVQGGMIATIALFSMPLIILWVGMGLAQGSSIAFAGVVQSKATGAMKWATYGGAWKGTKWAAKKSGIAGGVQQKYANWKKSGPLGSDRVAQREAMIAGKGPYKVPGALEKDAQRRSEEYKKDHTTEKELKEKAEKGDAGAALRLAEDGKIEEKQYRALMTLHKDDEGLQKLLSGKTAAKRADVVIDYKMENESEARAVKLANGAPITDAIRKDAKLQIAKEEYGKIAPGKIKEQNMAALVGYDEKSQSVSLKENDVARRKAIEDIHLKHIESGNFEKITADMDANKFSAARSVGVL